MKIKSLLMAAAAFAAFSLSAEPVISAPDIEITSEEQLGKLIEWPISLFPNEGDQYTNNEFHFTFPAGLYPKAAYYDEATDEVRAAEDGETPVFFSEVGADVTTTGRQHNPVVAYSDNFDVTDFWPNFKVVGANLTDTPNDGGEALLVYVEVREGVEDGEYPITTYVKFNIAGGENNQTDIDQRTIGTPEEEVEFAKLIVKLNQSVAVNDINAAKAVSSVKYYNAAGMASDTAFDGINIVVTKYADGSQSTAKVVK